MNTAELKSIFLTPPGFHVTNTSSKGAWTNSATGLSPYRGLNRAATTDPESDREV
jgi:hypothetical protein